MPERNTLTANKIVGLCILGGGIIWTVGSGLWWGVLTLPHLHGDSFEYLLPLITVLGSALGALLLLVGLVYLNQVMDGAIVADTAACFGTVALVIGLILASLGQGLVTLIAYIDYIRLMEIPDENMDIVGAILVVTVFVMSLGLATLAWGFSKGPYKRKWIFRMVAGVSLLPTVILVVALSAYPALLGDAFNLAIRICPIPQVIGYLMIGVETYTKT